MRFFESRKVAYQAFVEKQAARPSRSDLEGKDSSRVSIAGDTPETALSSRKSFAMLTYRRPKTFRWLSAAPLGLPVRVEADTAYRTRSD